MKYFVIVSSIFNLSVLTQAQAAFPDLSEGTYHFQSVPWMGTTQPSTPKSCEVIAVINISAVNDIFEVAIANLSYPPCQTQIEPNHRKYHLKRTNDFLCGATYASTETIPGGVGVNGDGVPVVIINDYRNAPDFCLRPTDSRPPLFPVIGLQEANPQDIKRWQSN